MTDPNESLEDVLAQMRKLSANCERIDDFRYEEFADRIQAALARGSERASEQHLREALGVARVFVESEARRRAGEGQNNHAMKVLQYIDECPALAGATGPADGTAPERADGVEVAYEDREPPLGPDRVATLRAVLTHLCTGARDWLDKIGAPASVKFHPYSPNGIMESLAGHARSILATRTPDGMPGEPDENAARDALRVAWQGLDENERDLLRDVAEDCSVDEDGGLSALDVDEHLKPSIPKLVAKALIVAEWRGYYDVLTPTPFGIALCDYGFHTPTAAPPTVPGEPPIDDELCYMAPSEIRDLCRERGAALREGAKHARMLAGWLDPEWQGAAPPTVPGEPAAVAEVLTRHGYDAASPAATVDTLIEQLHAAERRLGITRIEAVPPMPDDAYGAMAHAERYDLQSLPTAFGKVVEMTDLDSDGDVSAVVSVFRRDPSADTDAPEYQFVFVHHECMDVRFSPRLVALLGQNLAYMCAALDEKDYPFAHNSASKIVFVGVDLDDEIAWRDLDAEVVWDSAKEAVLAPNQ